jgi:hypothetical protein
MGGISGGAGNVAGNFVNEGLGLGLSQPMAATLGSGLVGGVAGELTGGDFLSGALQGAGGQLLKNAVPSGAPNNAFEAALQSGANTGGNMLTAGYSPTEAIQGGLTSGILSGAKEYIKPSNAVLSEVQNEMPSSSDMIDYTNSEGVMLDNGQLIDVTAEYTGPGSDMVSGIYKGQIYENGILKGPISAGVVNTGAGDTGDVSTEPNMFQKAMTYATENPLSTAGLALTAASALDAPEDVTQAVSSLSPEQQEYFNRPLVSWDWDKMRLDANNANMTLGAYMAYNMPTISQGYYNLSEPAGSYRGGPIKMNMGGLNQVSRYVRGRGTGRSDEIPAYLSDGEYVIDAETVALLGDGSNKAGANALDDMRKTVRKHKGGNLSKGKFSKDAKSPLQYLKGVA